MSLYYFWDKPSVSEPNFSLSRIQLLHSLYIIMITPNASLLAPSPSFVSHYRISYAPLLDQAAAIPVRAHVKNRRCRIVHVMLHTHAKSPD